jgi:hypothetical protein
MTRLQHSLAKPRRQRGATLVEFVVVFPLAVLFVLSLIQFGIVYMMKLELNHAAFMAARAGSMNHADPDIIRNTLLRGLNQSFEKQDTTSDAGRIGLSDLSHVKPLEIADPLQTVKVDIVNPSPAAFKDFGVVDPTAKPKVTYIPNDNIEFRSDAVGSTSKMNLRDANLLKIRVVYGYELKVPLMASVMKRLMCGGSTGVTAWGGQVSIVDSEFLPTSKQCLLYYDRNRIPLEAWATVDMQSAAYKK